MGAYCASKHALEGMSDSLRCELMLFGIDVVVIGGKVEASGWHRWAMSKLVSVAECSFAVVKELTSSFGSCTCHELLQVRAVN